MNVEAEEEDDDDAAEEEKDDDNEEEDAGGWGSAEEDDESAGIGSVSAIDGARRGNSLPPNFEFISNLSKINQLH